MPDMESCLTPKQAEALAALSSPDRIQAYLDSLLYPSGPENRCPARVMADGKGHCLDGALFAAFALRRLGHPPVIVDLLPEPGADDDHVLAIFRCGKGLGALAKSNFTTFARSPAHTRNDRYPFPCRPVNLLGWHPGCESRGFVQAARSS